MEYKYSLQYSLSALDDIEDIYEYTSATFGKEKANRVVNNIRLRNSILKSFPLSFKKIKIRNKNNEIHCMTQSPFLIYYEVNMIEKK